MGIGRMSLREKRKGGERREVEGLVGGGGGEGEEGSESGSEEEEGSEEEDWSGRRSI